MKKSVHVGSCVECGHNGPHDVQNYHGDLEFSCTGCGMQFPVPAETARSEIRRIRSQRAGVK